MDASRGRVSTVCILLCTKSTSRTRGTLEDRVPLSSLSSPHEFSYLSPLEKIMTKKSKVSCEGDQKAAWVCSRGDVPLMVPLLLVCYRPFYCCIFLFTILFLSLGLLEKSMAKKE